MNRAIFTFGFMITLCLPACLQLEQNTIDHIKEWQFLHAIRGYVKKKSEYGVLAYYFRVLYFFLALTHSLYSFSLVCYCCIFDWCLCFFTALQKKNTVRFQLTFNALLFRAHIRTWNPLIHSVVFVLICAAVVRCF